MKRPRMMKRKRPRLTKRERPRQVSAGMQAERHAELRAGLVLLSMEGARGRQVRHRHSPEYACPCVCERPHVGLTSNQ